MTHVICTNISGLDDLAYQKLYAGASRDRRERADRYRNREDSLRCLIAEALLRYVLRTKKYTLEKTQYGKPFIKDMPGFHFNLSHAGCWVVIAYGNGETGVDVEYIHRNTDKKAILNRFFCEEERCYVQKESAYSLERFFEIWTGKESYIKYLGTGLRKDLRSFNVRSAEIQKYLHHTKLGEAYCLSLYTREQGYSMQLLGPQQLLDWNSKEESV